MGARRRPRRIRRRPSANPRRRQDRDRQDLRLDERHGPSRRRNSAVGGARRCGSRCDNLGPMGRGQHAVRERPRDGGAPHTFGRRGRARRDFPLVLGLVHRPGRRPRNAHRNRRRRPGKRNRGRFAATVAAHGSGAGRRRPSRPPGSQDRAGRSRRRSLLGRKFMARAARDLRPVSNHGGGHRVRPAADARPPRPADARTDGPVCQDRRYLRRAVLARERLYGRGGERTGPDRHRLRRHHPRRRRAARLHRRRYGAGLAQAVGRGAPAVGAELPRPLLRPGSAQPAGLRGAGLDARALGAGWTGDDPSDRCAPPPRPGLTRTRRQGALGRHRGGTARWTGYMDGAIRAGEAAAAEVARALSSA